MANTKWNDVPKSGLEMFDICLDNRDQLHNTCVHSMNSNESQTFVKARNPLEFTILQLWTSFQLLEIPFKHMLSNFVFGYFHQFDTDCNPKLAITMHLNVHSKFKCNFNVMKCTRVYLVLFNERDSKLAFRKGLKK